MRKLNKPLNASLGNSPSSRLITATFQRQLPDFSIKKPIQWTGYKKLIKAELDKLQR